MSFPRARVFYSIAFLTLFMMMMVSARPSWIFAQDGSALPFGVGSGRTLFSLGTVTVVCAAVSLLAFSLVDLVSARRYELSAADILPAYATVVRGPREDYV